MLDRGSGSGNECAVSCVSCVGCVRGVAVRREAGADGAWTGGGSYDGAQSTGSLARKQQRTVADKAAGTRHVRQREFWRHGQNGECIPGGLITVAGVPRSSGCSVSHGLHAWQRVRWVVGVGWQLVGSSREQWTACGWRMADGSKQSEVEGWKGRVRNVRLGRGSG